MAAGRLSLPDPELAAYQFLELANAGLWRKRLFGKAPEPPSPDAVEANAEAAVTMFLAAYGVKG
ncbi:Transcriptional regulator, TetR family [Rubellimicrobium mesophilum DSM 19309]|uniref:Transcriptional regulator, TetR family n=1 Tax=Rubellimicrobium mesophilum DSM 19309 TaxID=442562 RepID=A0A017HWT7_9RHOB|nr:Transcriptional regulator, TetR family [Rubellimicrobium mesophilum DSM 19309]